ncbi:DUF4435 domain-containing protein [Flavobacterium plurextorum]|uniref:DUF4435 domain-containing protein n=1 Tax=Flavobacterium plurextorum TaxID=1114867 RepID=UPI003756F5BE
MSSSVDILFNAKDQISDNKTFVEIKQHYKHNSNSLHLFVEGEDDFEFYRKSIEFIYRGYEIKHYIKNGKKYVLSSYDVLDWDVYDKSRILFFVDKDYEDIFNTSSKKDRNIFVTKFYSIENYLSCKNTFRYTLSQIFKINDELIITSLVEKFENSFKKFEFQMIYLTSIILIYRRNNEYMDLDKLKMDDFFIIKDLNLYKKKYLRQDIFNQMMLSNAKPFEKSLLKKTKIIDDLARTEADLTKINFKVIRNNISELLKYSDSRFFIRGKFQLWFFIKCFSNVSSMAPTINTQIQNNVKTASSTQKLSINTSIVINESNIFDILPMKIYKHNDVNLFLLHNIQQING